MTDETPMSGDAVNDAVDAVKGIDLGMVVRDLEAMTAFYTDVIGLIHEEDVTMASGALMRRFRSGSSIIKLLKYPVDPPARGLGGGPSAATGLRYWTITVDQLDPYISRANTHGAAVVLGPVQARPGITIIMIEDPEGNWVELLELTES